MTVQPAMAKAAAAEERADATDCGVVVIVGAQGSGKSTLLNMAFGTHFPVRTVKSAGERRRSRRTTTGVWLDLAASDDLAAAGARPCVVVDVEGTEGLDRVDKASGSSKIFDAKCMLLALGLADVVVLNIWARDVLSRDDGGFDPVRGGPLIA